MQWSDVTAAPSRRVLRQFAGLCLVFLVGGAVYRAWQGHLTTGTWILGGAGAVIGVLGLIAPAAVRWVYTGWMIVAFPIGWTVSKLMLGTMFYAIFTPVALVFRVMRRDALHRQKPEVTSYWTPKAGAEDVKEYLRQY